MLLSLIITVFVFYIICGVFSFAFRLSWGIFKVLFRIGLFLISPALLILAILFSILGSSWIWIALIVLICVLGSRKTGVRA